MQASLKDPPSQAAPRPFDEVLDDSSSHLELHTSVQPVRLRTAEELGLDSWGKSFQGSPEQAQLFVDLHRSNPEAAHKIAQAITAMPEVGTEFVGFRLRAQLGEGAFARVFLAQQGELADRLVVLKVSPANDDESQALAQLQHTNIVPIYSRHQAGSLQALCMPYFGSTTLATILKQLQSHPSLPQSGREFVSTIVAAKSTVREVAASADSKVVCLSTGPDSVEGSAPSVNREAPDAQAPVADEGLRPWHSPRTTNFQTLQKLSYVEAVLWIGSRLADGLAHAHEHGIVHRDLKPANILFTDDGQPMLLDFNLAQDTKLSGTRILQVGGTMPFMAPEQLIAYRARCSSLDHRSDIYSLGVILYELLAGQPPFPAHTGPTREVLQDMIRDRLAPPPALRRWDPATRHWNKAVSPAIESIVRKCLQPRPDERYQTARELKDDLDRQLAHLPLRHAPEPSLRERFGKWRKRHPRLVSLTTLAVAAGIAVATLLSVVLIRGQRLAEIDARESLHQFLTEHKAAQYRLAARTDDAGELEAGVKLGRETLNSYHILEQASWKDQPAVQRLSPSNRAVLQQHAAELLLLLGRGLSLQAQSRDEPARTQLLSLALEFNSKAEHVWGEPASCPRALWEQRADLMRQTGRAQQAQDLEAQARDIPLQTAADHYLVGCDRVARGRFKEALPFLATATEKDPQDFWAWFLKGVCHDHLAQSTEAIGCYSACIALTPTSAWAYLNRGLTHLRQQNYVRAAADLDRAIALRPKLTEAYRNRALARQGLKRYADAVADLTEALRLGASPAHVYFLRAGLREKTGDAQGARQDREAGLRNSPSDELGWLSRGYDRIHTEPKAALDDFERALKLNPRSLAGLQNKAHLLGKMNRNQEAIETLSLLLEAYPDFLLARAGRAVLLARVQQRAAAHKDADDCLGRDRQPLTLYQLAGVYALTSKTHADDRRQAFRLLSAALQKGFGFDLLDTDRDLDPIRGCPEFQRLVDAARAIRSTVTPAPAAYKSAATGAR